MQMAVSLACKITILCILQSIWSQASLAQPVKNKTVNILCLLPYPSPLFQPSWREGPAVQVALNLARDEINNQTELLPDYAIQLYHDNSGCEHSTEAYLSFMQNTYGNKTLIGIIGPGCSTASLAVASVTSSPGVSLLTLHGGGSPLLANKDELPYALGTLGTSEAFAYIGLALMRKSNWDRVGVLFEESRIFYSSSVRRFEDIIIQNEFKIAFSSPVYDFFITLDVIANSGIRVNFLFTPVSNTQRVICLARHLGLVYPAYQWIITSNTFTEVSKNVTFEYNGIRYFCSENEMANALEKCLFLNYRLSPLNQSMPTDFSGHSGAEYDQIFRNLIESTPNVEYTVWSTYFYDSVWAWAVVLDKLDRNGFDLSAYEYGNTTATDMILSEFFNLDFNGVSGPVKFSNETHFLDRTVTVNQVVNGSTEFVAYHFRDTFTKVKDIILETIDDSFPITFTSPSYAGIAILFLLTLAQLVVLIILHVLTIYHRHYHTVKASSPKLAQLVFIGCYLFTFALLLHSLRALREFDNLTTVILCNLSWAWLLPVTFTLTFGTVSVRTWRLYRIFTHYINPGRFIGDYYLIGFVCILLLVDITVAIIWNATDPMLLSTDYYEIPNGSAVSQVAVRNCYSSSPFLWYGLVYGWRAVLIVVTFIMTMLTRNIRNPSFNTKALRQLVFLFTVVMVAGLLMFYIFLFYSPTTSLAFYALSITFNLMLFLYLSLVLFPPLYPKLKEWYRKKYPVTTKAEPYFTEDDESIPMEGSSRFYI